MNKVLLISNHVFHYRQKVYNFFSDKFSEAGYEFHVLANSFQQVGYDFRFVKHEEPFSVMAYCQKIESIHPDVVILFLHLKDRVELPLIYYCKRKKIPVVFWNKGNSDTDSNNRIKNAIYHHIHHICDALITYTPDTVDNFRKKDRYKLFVANNTIDYSEVDRTKFHSDAVRQRYGISESKVVLYISRLKKDKHLEYLLSALANVPDVAIVVMGAGMNEDWQMLFERVSNLYYVGQKYGEEGNEIWSMGDIYSVPVNCGLGINEAIFWGLPIVTMQGFQPPEIYYLKDGVNGYIVKDEQEYREKLLYLLRNDEVRVSMKKACEKIYREETDIKWMYQGFIQAIKYCENN